MGDDRPRTSPTMAETRNSTTATTKMIFAISIDTPAIPPNPRTAAISATTRNVKAHPSMGPAPSRWCGAWPLREANGRACLRFLAHGTRTRTKGLMRQIIRRQRDEGEGEAGEHGAAGHRHA